MKYVYASCGTTKKDDGDLAEEIEDRKVKKVKVATCNGCPNFVFGLGCCKRTRDPMIGINKDKDGKSRLVPKTRWHKLTTTFENANGYIAFLRPEQCDFEEDKTVHTDSAASDAGADTK